jgi:hypothetical protein
VTLAFRVTPPVIADKPEATERRIVHQGEESVGDECTVNEYEYFALANTFVLQPGRLLHCLTSDVIPISFCCGV